MLLPTLRWRGPRGAVFLERKPLAMYQRHRVQQEIGVTQMFMPGCFETAPREQFVNATGFNRRSG